MSDPRTLALIEDLRTRPSESNIVEFKENNADPKKIGTLISALANAACLANEPFGYVVWGIRDADRAIVGTKFRPGSTTYQNEPLEFWLAKRLRPDLHFSFKLVDHPSAKLVLLEVPAAATGAIEFDGCAYLRIDSATPRLSDHQDRLQALWGKLNPFAWEKGIAAQFLSASEVETLLDVNAYFQLTQQSQSSNFEVVLQKLASDGLVSPDVGGRWNITNLGAILFARDLSAFGTSVGRKGLRFTAYQGSGKASSVTHRRDFQRGYASGFLELIDYIDGLLPRNEHIDKAFRTERPLYPAIAIRESVANALIHQDFSIKGAGPQIELFPDRLEITNPGASLVAPDHFIDASPRSRNESLAALMRRMRLCEEQGSGIDKVVHAVELYQLPPPDFRVEPASTRVVLYAPREFSRMSEDERVRACFQHAVLRFISNDRMKNSTLRQRFGIESHNSAQVSQVIRRALERGLIRPADPAKPKAGYVPAWA